MLHEMLHTTLKPRNVRNGGTPVDPSAVPNSSGENDSSVLLSANYAGVNDSSVTVGASGGPSLPDDFHDAGEGGQDSRMGKSEVVKIANDIQKIYDANPKCQPFIAGILTHASSQSNPLVSTNPIDALWATYFRGSINVKNIGLHGGEALGNIAHNRAHPVKPTINLTPRNFSNVPDPSLHLSRASVATMNRTQELIRAQDALAEAIHLSGAFSYDDMQMSVALADYTHQKAPQYPFKLADDVGPWSRWWHPQVNNMCGIGNVLKLEGR